MTETWILHKDCIRARLLSIVLTVAHVGIQSNKGAKDLKRALGDTWPYSLESIELPGSCLAYQNSKVSHGPLVWGLSFLTGI